MIYLFLANGFEEIEALCPLDLLRRAGLSVTTVGIGGKTVTGSHGIEVKADLSDSECDLNHLEGIILPGGMPGTNNLEASGVVQGAIAAAVREKALIGAICAAPRILGHLGLLRGRKAICFPGFEGDLVGAEISSEKVVRDGIFITAAGMGVALEFGLALVAAFLGNEKAEAVRKAVQAK